jgi:hypothetical protein
MGTTLKLNVQGLSPEDSQPTEQIQPQAPPPPPPPLNFAQFASNPMMQQKVAAVVPGLTPPPALAPPTAPKPAAPAPPAPPISAPAPASGPAQSPMQSYKDWQQSNPQLQEKPLSGVQKALQIAAGIFGGGVPGGVQAGQAIHQHDLPSGLNAADLQRYQQGVVQPAQTNLALQDTASQIQQRQGAAAASNAKAAAVPQQIQAKRNQITAQLAAKGQVGTFDDDGNLTGVADDPNSEVIKKQAAQADYFNSRKELQDAQAELAKSKNNPNSPAFRQAQQRVNIAAQNAQTAAQRLGLSAQEFGFNQEKFYNPQPTATERSKGDLAQSAVERVHEMKDIIARRPDIFGPGAGRAQKAQIWLGSQDPDAQTYQSAAAYLAEHSAGVFGGRGKYILESLHGLTDQHANPAALGAALDEAERAASGFVTAAQVHHGPSGSTAPQNSPSSSPSSGSYTKTATGPNGHKIGYSTTDKKWHDVKTGAVVQ